MRKFKKALIVFACICAFTLFYTCSALGVAAQPSEVYIGGMPAGFTLGLEGAQVIGVCEILTRDGAACPARDAQLSVGDMIVEFNGVLIRSAEDIGAALKNYKGGAATITVKDGKESSKKQITPALDAVTGQFKLGVLIRDSIAGIGTVTYIEKDSHRFGSLGHAVTGNEGELMPISGEGSMYRCSIVNVVKGERGKAGELKGLFINDACVATADKNCETGIYGTFSAEYDYSALSTVEIGENASPGKASIYATVDGLSPKEYSVSIVKVDAQNGQNKNFVLKVTDKELLEETGGIVQGMSGSPIVQNGKLVGAVTHVFLNDPTRGYGIAIENMFGN